MQRKKTECIISVHSGSSRGVHNLGKSRQQYGCNGKNKLHNLSRFWWNALPPYINNAQAIATGNCHIVLCYIVIATSYCHRQYDCLYVNTTKYGLPAANSVCCMNELMTGSTALVFGVTAFR